MKQRIDASQLAELTLSQQEKLRNWWKPQYSDVFIFVNSSLCKCVDSINDLETTLAKDKILPLLSIGQCIELLNCMVNINNAFAEYPKAWCVMNMNKKKEYWAEELIDALWEVVKSIL